MLITNPCLVHCLLKVSQERHTGPLAAKTVGCLRFEAVSFIPGADTQLTFSKHARVFRREATSILWADFPLMPLPFCINHRLRSHPCKTKPNKHPHNLPPPHPTPSHLPLGAAIATVFSFVEIKSVISPTSLHSLSANVVKSASSVHYSQKLYPPHSSGASSLRNPLGPVWSLSTGCCGSFHLGETPSWLP